MSKILLGFALAPAAVACKPPVEASAAAVQTRAHQAPTATPQATLALAGKSVRDFDGPRLPLPERPSDATSGSEFVAATAKVSAAARELMIEREVLRGNVPDFLRELRQVEIEGAAPNGEPVAIRLWVMPDYVAVGSNDDFVRMPMTLRTATRLALATGMALPTPRIVKHVAARATRRATPHPFAPGPDMVTSGAFERHNRVIEDEIGRHLFGELVAGHKKDIVVSKLSLETPDRIVIFGWHDRDNKPIQGICNVHDEGYVDYSHGVRLVSQAVEIDGTPATLSQALASGRTAALVSHEGPIADYAALLQGDEPVHTASR